MSKYLANNYSGRSNSKLWIALVAILLALVLLIFAACNIFTSPEKPDKDPSSPDSGENNPPSTQNPDDSQNPGGNGDSQNPGNTPGGNGNADISDPVTPPPAPGSEAEALAQADKLSKGYFYDEAIAVLSKFSGSAVDAKKQEIQALKDGLVKYEGRVYHVFFHSLIIDTDLAFDNKGSSARGYNEVMTTVSEFKKMLPLLMENDFVLYDITETCEYKDGKVVQKDIYLPEGKKPLIVSIDDVNYYTYMVDDGFARYLDVDENGRVVTMVGGTPIRHTDAKKHVKGYENCEVSYEGDVMPILDTFVSEHPEFSFRGAKGIVAITGYEGAFGYRITDLDWFTKAEQEQMLNKVREVANALRNTGWQIANHSYTHNQYWNNKTMTMEQLKYDTGRWINDIMPYVGETHILISPFGVSFKSSDERMKYITEDLGFYIYCPVGSTLNTQFNDTYMLNERLNLDGMTMLWYPERISKYFFDPALVVDPARPELTK